MDANFHAAHYETASEAMMLCVSALPENNPDWGTAQRAIEVVKLALGHIRRLLPHAPEAIRASLEFSLDASLCFWLELTEKHVAAHNDLCAKADGAFHFIRACGDDAELVRVGDVETVERRYWTPLPTSE
jgi:hypothetical protein